MGRKRGRERGRERSRREVGGGGEVESKCLYTPVHGSYFITYFDFVWRLGLIFNIQ